MFCIFVAWTIIYLANQWLQPVALKKEFPDSLEQKLARIQQCSIKVLRVLMPWKGTKEAFADSHPLRQKILTGFRSGTVCGGVLFRIMLSPLSSQRNRSTTRTKVYLCLYEPSRICSNQAINGVRNRINGVRNRFKALLDERLPGRKWLQKCGWLTKRTLFK